MVVVWNRWIDLMARYVWLALQRAASQHAGERVVNLLEIWENALIYLTVVLYGLGRHTGMIVWNDRTLFLSPHHGRLWGLNLYRFCGFPVEWSIIPGGHNGQDSIYRSCRWQLAIWHCIKGISQSILVSLMVYGDGWIDGWSDGLGEEKSVVFVPITQKISQN